MAKRTLDGQRVLKTKRIPGQDGQLLVKLRAETIGDAEPRWVRMSVKHFREKIRYEPTTR